MTSSGKNTEKNKVDYRGRTEGVDFLRVYEKEILSAGLTRLHVHSSVDKNPERDTIYSFCNPGDYATLKPTMTTVEMTLQSLRVLNEGFDWGGCKDMTWSTPGDLALRSSGIIYASYFVAPNILFICDLAHAWGNEEAISTVQQELSAKFLKEVLAIVTDFKSNFQIKKKSSRISLVLEDWGRPI